jgi:hypothetical protein
MPEQKSNFWLNPEFEPKRQFRYLVELTIGGQNLQFLAKSVDRPSYTISSNPHQFFNHTFHYPGRIEWNSISLTLVDPVNPNGAKILYEYLSSIGIEKPTSINAAIGTTITKESATSALGNLVIKEMGARLTRETASRQPETVVIGNWQFLNAYLTDVNFGSQDYGSEDMVEISLTVQYDWAEYQRGDVQARGS